MPELIYLIFWRIEYQGYDNSTREKDGMSKDVSFEEFNEVNQNRNIPFSGKNNTCHNLVGIAKGK